MVFCFGLFGTVLWVSLALGKGGVGAEATCGPPPLGVMGSALLSGVTRSSHFPFLSWVGVGVADALLLFQL